MRTIVTYTQTHTHTHPQADFPKKYYLGVYGVARSMHMSEKFCETIGIKRLLSRDWTVVIPHLLDYRHVYWSRFNMFSTLRFDLLLIVDSVITLWRA